jgi:hypothetical protein
MLPVGRPRDLEIQVVQLLGAAE